MSPAKPPRLLLGLIFFQDVPCHLGMPHLGDLFSWETPLLETHRRRILFWGLLQKVGAYNLQTLATLGFKFETFHATGHPSLSQIPLPPPSMAIHPMSPLPAVCGGMGNPESC